MSTPFVILKYIARSVQEITADRFFFEVLGVIAREAWKGWCSEKSVESRKAELEALAQAPLDELRQQSAEAAEEVAFDKSTEVRKALANYLIQVAVRIQQAWKYTHDPTNDKSSQGFSLQNENDLLPFLPSRMPRFSPGDRPLSGVDWELEELLGIGGFGEVWKARNPHFDGVPPVALKFCLDPVAKDRLLRHEAAVLNRIMRQGKHPGIVQLQHTYMSNDPPCLEYEYVEGGSLAGLIDYWNRSGTGPTSEQAADIVYCLAQIIGFAHGIDPPIVHRDLKPSNILIPRSADGKLYFKITDFGIGSLALHKAVEGNLAGTTRDNLLLTAMQGAHTPLYSSPQQVRGEPTDPRDDVYSLGVIWYQLLTGDLNTGRPGGLRWAKRFVEQGHPPAFVELLAACIEESASDRPENAATLAQELYMLLESGPPPTACDFGVKAAENVQSQLHPPAQNQPLPPVKESCREIRRFLGHEVMVNSVAFSPDGRYLLSAGGGQERMPGGSGDCRVRDCTIRLWDVQGGQELRCFKDHQGPIRKALFSSDGRHFLSCSEDATLRLWDTTTRKETRRFQDHFNSIYAMAIDSAGMLAVTGGLDKKLCLWDLTAGKLLRRFEGHTDTIHAVVFSPKGGLILSGGEDKIGRLWVVASGKEVRRLVGHTNWIEGVAFSPDGRFAFSCSRDGTIRQWDLTTGTEKRRFQIDSLSILFTPDGKHLLNNERGTVSLLDLETGDNSPCFSYDSREGAYCLAISPDNRFIASGSYQTVRLWEFTK